MRSRHPLSLQDRRREEDIVRALRLFTSRERRDAGGTRIPIVALAAMCGVHRDTIYEARRGIMTDTTRAVLLSVIGEIEAGRIRFVRRYLQGAKSGQLAGSEWETDFRSPPARLPPPQPRVIPAADYNEWAACRSCGCPRFSRFVGLAGKAFFACDGCVSEADRQMLGAKPRAR